MTAPQRPTPTKRSRKAPSPNSILDRQAFEAALDEAGLTIKMIHIDTFYQALHRQHYPDLPEFVANYYNNEQTIGSAESVETQFPLKNSVSAKKNRNLKQMPRVFLDFIRTQKDFVTVTSKVALAKTSADGSTTKLAIQLHDGQLVESVLMRYTRTAVGSRASLCVSSQCGCAMGCTFCATGTMGLSGSLTTGEILEQIVHADRILAQQWMERLEQGGGDGGEQGSENLPKLDLVRNVVFMGMGEPLDNYNNVVGACRALIDRRRWNLAHGRVTVSTVGIISKICKLTRDLPEVSLALSLHAPNQAMRSAIVPSAKHYPIEDLIDALDGHMMAYLKRRKGSQNKDDLSAFTEEERIKESCRRRAMIEYIMLEGDTSTLDCAHQLGKLCENRQLVVNLIPYNQTDVKDKLHCPSDECMMEFRNIVASYGTFCTIRRTMGADIDSACGQLITLRDTVEEPDPDPTSTPVRDIEDVALDTRLEKVAPVRRLVGGKSATSETNGARSTTRENDSSETACPSDDGNVDLEQWVRPLANATAIAALCFLVSGVLVLRRNKR